MLDSEPGGKIGASDGEFSVCQFFDDGRYEYTRRWVGIEEAMRAFKHYTTSVGARAGMVERVIVTDGGDCTNAEWKRGKGYTYPPELVELQKEARKKGPA